MGLQVTQNEANSDCQRTIVHEWKIVLWPFEHVALLFSRYGSGWISRQKKKAIGRRDFFMGKLFYYSPSLIGFVSLKILRNK